MNTIISIIIAVASLGLAIGMILLARWDADRVIKRLYEEEWKERNSQNAYEVKQAVTKEKTRI